MMRLRRWNSVLLATLFLLLTPGWSQEIPLVDVLPETKERVADLWGNELRLYFDLPDNFLVFTDTARSVRSQVTFGLNERNDLMLAYLRASNVATTLKSDGQKDSGVAITLRGKNVDFKVARREGRSWVVLYVDNGEGHQARFAVPQAWEIKDPKLKELIDIKQGFERLMLKAAL